MSRVTHSPSHSQKTKLQLNVMGKKSLTALLFILSCFYINPSQGACGTYLELVGPKPPPRKPKGLVKNRYQKPEVHFKLIEEALRAGKHIPQLLKIYEKTIPLDYLFEIYAESYPRGEEHGALWHIRPRQSAYELTSLEKNKYIKVKTEYDETTKGLFDYFHRQHQSDPAIGDYWASRESPELFETIKSEWNTRARWVKGIFFSARTTGADRQLPMARLRAEGVPVIGVADPQIAVSYIVTASGIPEIANPHLALDPTSGRVTQYSSLATHDWRELDSVVWINPAISHKMKNYSRAWLEIHHLLKKSKTMATDKETQKLSQKFRRFAEKEAEQGSVALDTGKGFTPEGAYWWRLAEIEIYRSQRVFHSFNHLLSEVLRNPNGLAPNYQVTRYGPIHEREFPMHLSALGLNVSKAPQHLSPLIKLTYEEGKSTQPLSLEGAIDRIYNNERERIKKFGDKVPDPEVKKLVELFLLEYPKVSADEIQIEANAQRQRFVDMGKGPKD